MLRQLCFRSACIFALGITCAGTALAQSGSSPTPADQAQPLIPQLALAQDDPTAGSPYIPVDSWIYPAMQRLAALGYVDSAFLGLRPWTRRSVANMLAETSSKLNDSSGDEEAWSIYLALTREVLPELTEVEDTGHVLMLDSVYSRALGIAGTPLRDSYHVGQTIVNDYGRPYEEGFNNVTGFAAHGIKSRFALDFRGEYQHAPSATGYSPAVAQVLSGLDRVPYGPNQATIPQGPIAAVNPFRIVEANLSASLTGHMFSFGKSDEWMAPAAGGSFAWSNNAEDIYSFRINRIEPLRIPLLSSFLGPFRYDFLVGSLKGHTAPNDPWVHGEKISFKPTRNLEFGFARTVIWGGKGHVPITLHTFLRSFFSVSNVTAAVKQSRSDPGARFGTFDFTYRLPYMRKWLTLYTDSFAHDDVSPLDAPRRAAVRPGLYLSHFPGADKLDLRVEAVSTDPPHRGSHAGQFFYFEAAQLQGYTNKGQIFGDWIGREAKGGQAWLTYHLSPSEDVQLSWRSAKAAKDFIPGGTTQNDFTVQVIKNIRPDLELNAWVQAERWKAPLLKAGPQNDLSTAVQLTWRPKTLKR